MKNHRIAIRRAVIAAALGLALTAPTAGVAQNDPGKGINRGLLKTYSSQWWQWALSVPATANALAFNDAVQSSRYCGVGQHGGVWFLGGTLDGSPATRACTVPADTQIFFPIINAECSTVEGNGTTEQELWACAKDLIDHVTLVEASVDGVPVRNADKARVQSDPFSFALPPGDVLALFGNSPNPSPSVADGYWVLLPPLAAGAHEIRFRAWRCSPASPSSRT